MVAILRTLPQLLWCARAAAAAPGAAAAAAVVLGEEGRRAKPAVLEKLCTTRAGATSTVASTHHTLMQHDRDYTTRSLPGF